MAGLVFQTSAAVLVPTAAFLVAQKTDFLELWAPSVVGRKSFDAFDKQDVAEVGRKSFGDFDKRDVAEHIAVAAALVFIGAGSFAGSPLLASATSWIFSKACDATGWAFHSTCKLISWIFDHVCNTTRWVFDHVCDTTRWAFDKVSNATHWVFNNTFDPENWTLVAKNSLSVALPALAATFVLTKLIANAPSGNSDEKGLFSVQRIPNLKTLRSITALIAGVAGTLFLGAVTYGTVSSIAPMANWITTKING